MVVKKGALEREEEKTRATRVLQLNIYKLDIIDKQFTVMLPLCSKKRCYYSQNL